MTPVELRDLASELADVADRITLAAFRRASEVRTKADGSWVTDADVGVESTLRERIRRRFPDHGFLGEEEGASSGGRDGLSWVVDPIDGTSNFVRGNPIFATLIAVCSGGSGMAAVVSAPALGTRWDAARGAGTRQDGRHVRVSTVGRLEDAEVAFGGLDLLDRAGHRRAVMELVGRTRRQRGYGDFWQHCLVAAGCTEIALEEDVNVWDLAAVKLVVEEAGGRFSSLTGEPTASGGSALSTNGVLHDEVLGIVGGG